jgi:glycosyltransferase involved in cell wall biosynthesis
MLGLRGFPGVQGGVEKHVEHLAAELTALGCKVDVVVRSSYMKHHHEVSYCGVRFVRLWAPKSARFEAIVHSFFGVFVAAWKRPDVLHIHAIGPALMTPLARLLGLRVVVTHHGHDYDRQKWGRVAKTVLRAGEFFGAKYANATIAISRGIAKSLETQFFTQARFIPNGVVTPEKRAPNQVLEKLQLTSGLYVLMVGRLVPEKRHLDAIEAFRLAKLQDWKLVVVGQADFKSAYVDEVRVAASHAGVVMAGLQVGADLAGLYSHAGIFVLPSSHEGMPIVLLEALSVGATVVASDIEANRELELAPEHYFPVGDVETFAQRLREFAAKPRNAEAAERLALSVIARYRWSQIAKQTLDVYADVVKPRIQTFAGKAACNRHDFRRRGMISSDRL